MSSPNQRVRAASRPAEPLAPSADAHAVARHLFKSSDADVRRITGWAVSGWDGDLDAYWRYGFYVIEGLLDQAELDDLEADIADVLDRAPVAAGTP